MNRELDERIRARAYAIWEEEGRPDGQDFSHWLRAVEEIEAQETVPGILSGASTRLGDPDRPNARPDMARPDADADKADTAAASGEPAGALHATALPGAAPAPAAQGSQVRATGEKAGQPVDQSQPQAQAEPQASAKHRKLAEDYLRLGGSRRSKIDDNITRTRIWQKDPPEAERFWSEKIENLAPADRKQVEFFLPTINAI